MPLDLYFCLHAGESFTEQSRELFAGTHIIVLEEGARDDSIDSAEEELSLGRNIQKSDLAKLMLDSVWPKTAEKIYMSDATFAVAAIPPDEPPTWKTSMSPWLTSAILFLSCLGTPKILLRLMTRQLFGLTGQSQTAKEACLRK